MYLSGCHLPTAVLPTSINTTQLSSGQHRNTAATQPSLYSDVKNDNSSRVDEAGRVDDPLELPGSVAPLPHLANNMQECRIHTLDARAGNNGLRSETLRRSTSAPAPRARRPGSWPPAASPRPPPPPGRGHRAWSWAGAGAGAGAGPRR